MGVMLADGNNQLLSFPPSIIQHAIWLHVRFGLSLYDVKDCWPNAALR